MIVKINNEYYRMANLIKITNKELIKTLVGETADFPRYISQILNLANQNSQGTRPRVVGQLSELIKECPESTYSGWKKWYLDKHPDSIKNATQRITDMVNKLKDALGRIDRPVIKRWVEDLVLEKTFMGLRFQSAILAKIAELKGGKYRLATPQEESRGIDGYANNIAVSIKPHKYKVKSALSEKIGARVVYYEKKKDGLVIDITNYEDGNTS